jgi:hypothetical protein
VKTAAGAYPATLVEAGKTSRWDKSATFMDQGTSSSAAKQHQKGGMMPEGQVIKIASYQDWSVEKDVWDRPVSRSRGVVELVKIKGEDYCRQYDRTSGASFQGGWSTAGVGGGESKFRISACK